MKRIISLVEAGALTGKSAKGISLFLLFLLMLLVHSKTPAATLYKISDKAKIYVQQASADSVCLKMDNDFSVPVSVKLVIETKNLQGSDTSAVTAVIPAKATGFTIAGYKKKISGLAYTLNYNWKIVLGDVTKMPDLKYVYSFPFLKATACKVSQGPGGAFSHQDMFAYDFLMPVGTPVTAARDGIVASLRSDSFTGGPDKAYTDDANYISIYHEDGTIANYFHLNTYGVLVKEGQYVKKGEVIGYSGNTGFTSGPHLHFEVVQPALVPGKNTFVEFTWENRPEAFFAGARTASPSH